MSVPPPPLAAALLRPVGPALGRLARPFGQAALLAAINRALRSRLAEGRGGFLAGRVLGIAMPDLRIEWRFTLAPDGARLVAATGPAEAVIRGDSVVLLMLAARRTDPDTLFFERRLALEGDTALGLEARNLLDTLEPGDLPAPLARVLDRAGRLAQAFSG